MIISLILIIILVVITFVFENIIVSGIFLGVFITWNILFAVYKYNCKQVSALVNILCQLNISEQPQDYKNSMREELFNGMSWLQRIIYEKHKGGYLNEL